MLKSGIKSELDRDSGHSIPAKVSHTLRKPDQNRSQKTEDRVWFVFFIPENTVFYTTALSALHHWVGEGIKYVMASFPEYSACLGNTANSGFLLLLTQG